MYEKYLIIKKTTLEKVLKEAEEIINKEFNLFLKRSKLVLYNEREWNLFCKINNFNQYSEGLYSPIDYHAYVRTDSEVLISNIYHELYGHGFFIENSILGKELIKRIKKENHQSIKRFMHKLIDYRDQQYGIAPTNYLNYEGFAVWMESWLCEKTGNQEIFDIKNKYLLPEYKYAYNLFKAYEEKFTEFGIIAKMGFPKFYTNEKIINILKKLYHERFYNIDFIILYGSKKPNSDIDLFIVSKNDSLNYFNGWLDIYQLNRDEFLKSLKKLDISVTDPLFSGELIYGDANYYENLKKKILAFPITKEMIKYNLIEAKKQEALIEYYLKYFDSKNISKRSLKIMLKYGYSFRKNAELLKRGIKALTYKNILEKDSKNIHTSQQHL